MAHELAEKAKAILERILYITLATVSEDGRPWNTPLYAAYDDDYTFYWVSPINTEHSRHIEKNPKVFLAIYDSTVPEGTGEGVYIQAHASVVTDLKELARAAYLLYTRKKKPIKDVSRFLNLRPRRIYKAVPEKVWLNTYKKVGDDYLDGRVEVDLLSSRFDTMNP